MSDSYMKLSRVVQKEDYRLSNARSAMGGRHSVRRTLPGSVHCSAVHTVGCTYTAKKDWVKDL